MENPNVQPPQEEKKQERKATESYYPLQPPSRRGYYTVIAVILMLTVAALFARGHWLRIRDVEVTGLKHYTVEKIAAQAGITAKSTYFNLNESRVAANIEKDRYLRFDGMEKIWPNKVILHVYEREETFNLLNLGVQYILSADGMVLTNSNKMQLDNGCVNVTGIQVRDIRVGAMVLCDNESQLEALQALYEELSIQGFLDEIAELNMTSLDSIYLVTLDGYTANIGGTEELRAKIGTVRAVVQELRREEEYGGMIEATVPGQATYRPVQK
ncbi:MAG: FtsQ-type POTRA domain-containing protein [Clostridia bacterium]|nr:FtsQ-type POTRA domain-containing protein [Clostridia bacterium]